jgi:predicted Rossmann-fold nucleotide-binding protein
MLTWNDHNNSRDLRVSDRFSRDLRVSDKCDEYKLVVACGCRTGAMSMSWS